MYKVTLKYLAGLTAFTLVYVAAAKFGLWLVPGVHNSVTPVWPPAGIVSNKPYFRRSSKWLSTPASMCSRYNVACLPDRRHRLAGRYPCNPCVAVKSYGPAYRSGYSRSARKYHEEQRGMIGSGISLSGGEAICIVEGHGGTVAARTHADDHMLYTIQFRWMPSC